MEARAQGVNNKSVLQSFSQSTSLLISGKNTVINFILIHVQRRILQSSNVLRQVKKKVRSEITNRRDKTNEKRFESCAQDWIVTP